jgi:hypothetical protein
MKGGLVGETLIPLAVGIIILAGLSEAVFGEASICPAIYAVVFVILVIITIVKNSSRKNKP